MVTNLSIRQKVLLTLYRLSKKSSGKVRYEEIVVRAFKDYRADFHLKGYPQYPDSGGSVHKRLYDYRKKGMVSVANGMFSLTSRGLAEARRVASAEKGSPRPFEAGRRLERDVQMEVDRIKKLESLKLFLAGKHDTIIDSDLFDYLGVSVRANRNDFTGRLEAVASAVGAARAASRDPAVAAVAQFHDFMMARFQEEIIFKKTAGAPHRSA